MATNVIDIVTVREFTADEDYILQPGEQLQAMVHSFKTLTVYLPAAVDCKGSPCSVWRQGSGGDVYIKPNADSGDGINDQDVVVLGTNATGGYECLNMRSSGAPVPGWAVESRFQGVL